MTCEEIGRSMWTCKKCGPSLTCNCGAPRWLIDAYMKVFFNDYTQPMTIAECDAARAFRQQAAKEPYAPSTPIDDGPNPGEMELDWLAINREFS